MRKSRFSDEQIVAILAESDGGVRTPELCRRYGINQNRGDTTFEGGGVVELWVPFALLDNAVLHVGEWADQRIREDIEGIKCHLFRQGFSELVYGHKSISLRPFRFGQVALREYTLHYQVVTKERIFSKGQKRASFVIEFSDL